jgi:MoxR-like ATPase
VTDAETIHSLIVAVRGVYVAPAVKKYLIDIVTATRQSRDLRLGASPRASLQLLRAGRAKAALSGRDYVLPDDIADLAVSVLAHRTLPSTEAQLSRRSVSEIITKAVQSVPVPDKR